jgi:hypothetical protein
MTSARVRAVPAARSYGKFQLNTGHADDFFTRPDRPEVPTEPERRGQP